MLMANPYKKDKKPRYKGKHKRVQYKKNSMRDMSLMANACFMVRVTSVVAFEEACNSYGLDYNDVVESLMDSFVKDLNRE